MTLRLWRRRIGAVVVDLLGLWVDKTGSTLCRTMAISSYDEKAARWATVTLSVLTPNAKNQFEV